MKSFQRQNQIQPNKTFLICKKVNKCEQPLRKTSRGIPRIPLKGVLNFHHRRKYHLPEFIQMSSSTLVRRSEKVQVSAKSEQKKAAQTIRHTHHATDIKDLFKEKIQKMEGTLMKEFTREIAKCSMASYRTLYLQEFSKNRSAWKFKERLGRSKEKAQKVESQQPQCKSFKKLDRLNDTVYYFGEESAFLNLIKKFRFENLKPSGQGDKSALSVSSKRKQGQRRKRQGEFAPFRRIQDNVQKQKEPEKMMRLSNGKPDLARTARKLSSLSPWEMTVDPQIVSPAGFDAHL